jgi:hypothetical protein
MFEDDDLKHALRRVEPPAGFDQRVLARLDQQPSRQRRTAPRFTAWVTAAGLSFASLAGVAIYQHQLEQRKGMEARDQLMLALRITGKKLDAVRTTINNEEQGQTQQ